jgi:hypothetical protein
MRGRATDNRRSKNVELLNFARPRGSVAGFSVVGENEGGFDPPSFIVDHAAFLFFSCTAVLLICPIAVSNSSASTAAIAVSIVETSLSFLPTATAALHEFDWTCTVAYGEHEIVGTIHSPPGVNAFALLLQAFSLFPSDTHFCPVNAKCRIVHHRNLLT